MSEEFSVGQPVIVEGDNHRGGWTEPHPLPVLKIGKKWVTIGSGYRQERFDLGERQDAPNDGPYALDGGDCSSRGRVWRDQAHMDAYRQKARAWALVTGLARERTYPPGHLTTEQIVAIAELLAPPA